MTTPRITAILPVFNGEKHIEAALNTILNQSLLPIEIIIVNDGSTDDSGPAIALALSQRSSDVPIRVITQSNAGQSAARNAAAAVASGELLAFLDQDDLWSGTHLEALSKEFATDAELGWAYSDFDEIDSAGLLVTRNFIEAHGIRHPRLSLISLVSADLMVLPSASVIRRSAYLAVGGFDVNLTGYEDDDLFIRIFRAGWQSKFVPFALTRFRVHPGSSSTSASFRLSREVFFDKLRESIPDDARLSRYYITDLVLPRLLRTTLGEYSTALVLRKDSEARELARLMTRMQSTVGHGFRRRVELAVINRPWLCRASLRVIRRLPKVLRPRFAPMLRAG